MYAEISSFGDRAESRNFQTSAADCSSIRNTLDELFGGRATLEWLDPTAKATLFAHLGRCSDCCRAFDARIRFGSPRRTIY